MESGSLLPFFRPPAATLTDSKGKLKVVSYFHVVNWLCKNFLF